MSITRTAVESGRGYDARITWFKLLVASFLAHWPFFVIPLAYLATNQWLLADLASRTGMIALLNIRSMLMLAVPTALFGLLILRFIQFAVFIRPPSPTRAFCADIRRVVTTPKIFITALPVIAAMVLFNTAVLEFKPNIPKVNPFSWDETFMVLDRTLHFGADPWRLLQPLFGHDAVTWVLNNAYNFWFAVMFTSWFWFAFRPRMTILRSQFFLSFMLTWWTGGALMALFFSSAGPAYYADLGLEPNPFAELMAYHLDVDARLQLLFLDAQQLLRDTWLSGSDKFVGISAFPSMHNATAALIALAAWRVNRTAGIALTVYSTMILIGSVHTGWHYAVDSYVGIAIAILCWCIAGRLAEWIQHHSATRRLNAALERV